MLGICSCFVSHCVIKSRSCVETALGVCQFPTAGTQLFCLGGIICALLRGAALGSNAGISMASSKVFG